MSAVREKQLTVDEFWTQYGQPDKRYELVRGGLVAMPPPNVEHSWIQGYVIADLINHVREYDLGRVLPECDFQLGEGTVRRPDVAFVEKSRLALIPDPKRFAPIAPDLAVEVISPSETAGSIHDKVRDYRNAGVLLVWVIYPDSKEVVVHYPNGSAQTLMIGDTLNGGDVLPGFEMAVAAIFVS